MKQIVHFCVFYDNQVLGKYFNTIVTGVAEYLLNYAFELVSIEGNNNKKCRTIVSIFWMKMHVLCILISYTFAILPVVLITRCE